MLDFELRLGIIFSISYAKLESKANLSSLKILISHLFSKVLLVLINSLERMHY
ncbi:hypothetical protein VCRA2130O400_280011 [Vibrio crassostreae]|nr:hypothetical protein VCRA2130O400_280011 [Vibrio crassostreae]